MNAALAARIASGLDRPVPPEVGAIAAELAGAANAVAVLFYGSNLRSGDLEGVLDFYCLLPGRRECGIWPRVSYHEVRCGPRTVRAKVATMTLATFAAAAGGALLDTTVWTRFAQPSALIWARDAAAREAVIDAVANAVATASRLAALSGPAHGAEAEYWSALFRATYASELRIEPQGRAAAIVAGGGGHFEGLLPLAWERAGIAFTASAGRLAPELAGQDRAAIARWWHRRRRVGKLLNLVRLVRAAATFEGAARYASWKIERHTGVAIALTPWRERHPLLAAPVALWALWRARRRPIPRG